jgi:hypothetical protein
VITLRSEVNVHGIHGEEFLDFMLNCTDVDYQEWWPGVHLAFHTIQRYPGEIGNIVFIDEYVGETHLKFKGVITEYVLGRKIVWQMIMGMKLPAWVEIECEQRSNQLHITHTLTAGFQGLGKIFDPLFRIYLSEGFSVALDQHAQIEFPMLAEILIKRRKMVD